MASIKTTINNVIFELLDTGVARTINAAGAVQSTGTWSTLNAHQDNTVTIKIANSTGIVIDADYTFDDNNLLNIAIPVQSGIAAAAATPFPGRIELTDAGQLTYHIMSGPGAFINNQIYVYGNLKIDEAADQMKVVLARTGVTTIIQGDDQLDGTANSLTADQVFDSAGKTQDTLVFAATTTNPGTAGSYLVPASLSFAGIWDLVNGQVVFVMNAGQGGAIQGAIAVGFGGLIKGVSGGLEIYLGPDGNTQLALTVAGTHQWNSGAASWNLSLGYSTNQKTFAMTMEIDSNSTSNQYPNFKVGGKLNIAQSAGGPLQVDMSLDVTTTFKGGKLVFEATYNGKSYNLALEGTLSVQNYNVTFSIKYTNASGAPNLSLNFGLASPGSSLQVEFSAVMGPTGWTANFSIRMAFTLTGGGLVPDPATLQTGAPTPAPAPAPAAAPGHGPALAAGTPPAAAQPPQV